MALKSSCGFDALVAGAEGAAATAAGGGLIGALALAEGLFLLTSAVDGFVGTTAGAGLLATPVGGGFAGSAEGVDSAGGA
jgi:hypothetical protein